MVSRQIEIDEDTDRILSELAKEYDGNLGKALSDLLLTHKSMDSFVDECEASHHDLLAAQKQRAELGFREGRFTSWEEVKRRNHL